MRILGNFPALAVMLLQAMHANAQQQCTDLSAIPVRFNVQWSEVYQSLQSQSSCTQNCHLGAAPAADLDLSNARFSLFYLVSQPSSQLQARLRVDPGNAYASLLFNKINCSQPEVGGVMPPGGQIPSSLQALIYDWIESGAYGESPEEPLVRDFIARTSFESNRRVRSAALP
jgi:hypothetical protein